MYVIEVDTFAEGFTFFEQLQRFGKDRIKHKPIIRIETEDKQLFQALILIFGDQVIETRGPIFEEQKFGPSPLDKTVIDFLDSIDKHEQIIYDILRIPSDQIQPVCVLPTRGEPLLTYQPPSDGSEQPVGVLPTLCEACGQPIEAGRQAGTRFCKRAECIRERQRLAAKKAYDAKYSKSARTASQEAKTDSPLSPSQPQPEGSFLTVPGPTPVGAKIFWTLPDGQILKSGELANELAAGTIPEGTLLEHSTRGAFRITKRSNGRLAPEQVAADPSPAGPPSPGSAPGADIDPED